MQYKSRLIAVERNHFASVLVAAERGTPPPARAVASLDSSSSSSLLDLVVVLLLPVLVVLLRLRSSSVGLGQRHGGGAAPRVERGTPPPARAVASLDSSSSSSLLDLVVVLLDLVVVLLDLVLVLRLRSSSVGLGQRPGGGAAPRVWSVALLRPRAPSPAGLPLFLAPRPRRRRPPPRPRPPPTPQVLLHGARPVAWCEGRGVDLPRNSSAWQYLGVGLVEVLRRERSARLRRVVVAVVVIAAPSWCVSGRRAGEASQSCSDVST